MLWLPLIQEVLKIANQFGATGKIDTADLAKDKLRPVFAAVKNDVIAELEGDNKTPATMSGSDDDKKHLIRFCQLELWKHTVQHVTGVTPFSDKAADKIRDEHEDRVRDAVLPSVNAGLSTGAFVDLVSNAELELTT
jgi:hypothetical protein